MGVAGIANFPFYCSVRPCNFRGRLAAERVLKLVCKPSYRTQTTPETQYLNISIQKEIAESEKKWHGFTWPIELSYSIPARISSSEIVPKLVA